MNRGTLAQLKTFMATQGDTFRTGYVVTEFAELQAFVAEVTRDPQAGAEVDDLLVYWYQYARLPASAVQMLQTRFRIVPAENDQARVADHLAELPCQGLISDQ